MILAILPNMVFADGTAKQIEPIEADSPLPMWGQTWRNLPHKEQVAFVTAMCIGWEAAESYVRKYTGDGSPPNFAVLGFLAPIGAPFSDVVGRLVQAMDTYYAISGNENVTLPDGFAYVVNNLANSPLK